MICLDIPPMDEYRVQLGGWVRSCNLILLGDISMHAPPTGISYWQLKLWVSSIVQLFDFLTIDILCITANLGHFLTFWYLTYYLNHPSPLNGYFSLYQQCWHASWEINFTHSSMYLFSFVLTPLTWEIIKYIFLCVNCKDKRNKWSRCVLLCIYFLLHWLHQQLENEATVSYYISIFFCINSINIHSIQNTFFPKTFLMFNQF